MTAVCVAFKAHLGWVNAVAVAVDSTTPKPLHLHRIDLIDTDDQAVKEPYHVAGGWRGLERVPRPANPADIIRRGRERQVESSIQKLREYKDLIKRERLKWTHAVVQTSRGRLGDDLEHILGSHAQIHVAEGEAIRDATRMALKTLKIKSVDQDEKSILDTASERLARSPEACDENMKSLKPTGAKTWRKEERLVALGAWLNRVR